MTNRRQFLTGLPVAAAVGFTTTAGSSAERAANEAKAARAAHGMVRASGSEIDITKQDAFPSVELTNHKGETQPFYETHINGKIVMMNFMSIREEANMPITATVAAIVKELGSKVGKEVHVISITRDPLHDTPEELAEFAANYDVPDGWEFLTGSKASSSDVAFRMYRMGKSANPDMKRKVDVIFYGNGSVGLWGAFPVDIRADDAASRVSWVMPQPMPADGKIRRAGPRVFNKYDTQNHNREV